MKARTYSQYRHGLVQPGALALVQGFIAKPRPGDAQSITTYPVGSAPMWAASVERKACSN